MTVFYLPRKFWGVAESKFYLRPLSFVSTSPYTGQRSPYGPIVQVWCCDLTYPAKTKEDWREFSGLISRQRGISGLIRIPDSERLRPGFDATIDETQEPWSDDTLFSDGTGWSEGGLPSSCVVAERALRGENEIEVKGLPSSTASVLRSGDLFELRPNGIPVSHGHLYEVTADARTDEDGHALLSFEPSLRAGVAIGDQVVLRDPTTVFRFASETEGTISRVAGDYGTLGFSFIEEPPTA